MSNNKKHEYVEKTQIDLNLNDEKSPRLKGKNSYTNSKNNLIANSASKPNFTNEFLYNANATGIGAKTNLSAKNKKQVYIPERKIDNIVNKLNSMFANSGSQLTNSNNNSSNINFN